MLVASHAATFVPARYEMSILEAPMGSEDTAETQLLPAQVREMQLDFTPL